MSTSDVDAGRAHADRWPDIPWCRPVTLAGGRLACRLCLGMPGAARRFAYAPAGKTLAEPIPAFATPAEHAAHIASTHPYLLDRRPT